MAKYFVMEAHYLDGQHRAFQFSEKEKGEDLLREGDLVLDVVGDYDICGPKPGKIFVVASIIENYEENYEGVVKRIILEEFRCTAQKPDFSLKFCLVSDVNECKEPCQHRERCPFRRLLLSHVP
ncbi:MAG: hypothetical protein V1845_00205 [bacterium]